MQLGRKEGAPRPTFTRGAASHTYWMRRQAETATTTPAISMDILRYHSGEAAVGLGMDGEPGRAGTPIITVLKSSGVVSRRLGLRQGTRVNGFLQGGNVIW